LRIVRLSDESGVTWQAIIRHLHVLADAGLVRHSRSGRQRFWELEPKRLEKAPRCLDQISAQWDVAVPRVKAFVEAWASAMSI
jgi:predicted transcriptional regulator